jgi:hypothetical protein
MKLIAVSVLPIVFVASFTHTMESDKPLVSISGSSSIGQSSSSRLTTPGPGRLINVPNNPIPYTTQRLPLNLPAPEEDSTERSYSKGSSRQSDDEETDPSYGPHNRRPIEQETEPYVDKESDDNFYRPPKPWYRRKKIIITVSCVLIGTATIATLWYLYKKNTRLTAQNFQLMEQLSTVKNQVAAIAVEKQNFINEVASLKDELIAQGKMYEQVLKITENEAEKSAIVGKIIFTISEKRYSFDEHCSYKQVKGLFNSAQNCDRTLYKVSRPFFLKKIEVFKHVNNNYYKSVSDWITEMDRKFST